MRIARQKVAAQKKRVEKRIKHATLARRVPTFTARKIQYEISDRVQAISYGGLGLMHSLARQSGLAVEMAEDLANSKWKKLNGRQKYDVNTTPRTKPERVKEQIVLEREFKNIVLKSEDVAEFNYKPTACTKSCRMIVVRKNLSVEKGESVLFDDVTYFFDITNDRKSTKEQIVFFCNDRGNQEHLVEQMKNGPRAFRAPVDNLYSNWADMVMASVA